MTIHPCNACRHLSDDGCIRDGMDVFGEPRDPFVERSHGRLKARWLGTCGVDGRFFEEVEILG